MAANQIEKGDYDIRLEVNSTDELGRLTSSLNSMAAQLKRNDQLQKELIANVSHELKAPLTIIRGYAETVKDVSWPDDAKRNASLDLIIDESERLRSIVQDILDYSQLQAGTIKLDPVAFALRPLLDDVLLKLDQHISGKKLSLLVEGADSIVFFDRKRLQQVIFNLVVNAIQYSYEASEILIKMQTQTKFNQNVLRLSIINQGPEIPPSELSAIWDRFHRSNQLRADEPIGTGLGLAIVKSIMDQHGSNYGVLSEDEHTEFWLELPVILSASPQG
ncbi:MAG: HAMP domain-containing histidine kinase [Clostridiaceae bacterium]|nr:HAMP domain-containing histidine kinase [Clostridiaceae bacterium]